MSYCYNPRTKITYLIPPKNPNNPKIRKAVSAPQGEVVKKTKVEEKQVS